VPDDLETTLAEVRAALLDREHLVRAIAAGRRKGRPLAWRRAELRPVDLASGPRLQVTTYDATQAHTANHDDDAAPGAVDALLAEPFGNWHVETTTDTIQVRVTKKGDALVHRSAATRDLAEARGHDRVKERLIPLDEPFLRELGVTDAQGALKPSRERKYRQVEEFVRALDVAIEAARTAGAIPGDAGRPLRVVDLGCGNAYLTFAAAAYLARRGVRAEFVGVDVKAQSRAHNTAVAERLGVADTLSFVEGSIADAVLEEPPDVVLALHACDTATDDALARAVGWGSGLVLAAPCCHHDVARQLRSVTPPTGYQEVLRHGILRERLADTLTDAFRANLLREHGYRVDVIDFVESRHTPRNTLIRAVRTGHVSERATRDQDALVASWGVRPALADRIGDHSA
jgi:SAM-dependent methyltransferase